MHRVNPIIVPVRNNLHLTQKAVKTFEEQDIDGSVLIMVIDNGSTDGTSHWLKTKKVLSSYFNPPKSVAASWNFGLRFWFDVAEIGHVLVVNNDVELRKDTYRRLVDNGGLFVTAVGTKDRTSIFDLRPPNPDSIRPHPDFSCYLIRREAWEKVGEFDETFKGAFCEDGDYDLRLYKAGIRAYCLDLPFYHHGSATINNAEDEEARRIADQAGLNREYFTRKWGFPMGSPEYYSALGKGDPPPEMSLT